MTELDSKCLCANDVTLEEGISRFQLNINV